MKTRGGTRPDVTKLKDSSRYLNSLNAFPLNRSRSRRNVSFVRKPAFILIMVTANQAKPPRIDMRPRMNNEVGTCRMRKIFRRRNAWICVETTKNKREKDGNLRLFNFTAEKYETVDVNQRKINSCDCQTIPIVDEEVEFYPGHGIICPNSPFFEKAPVDWHWNNDEYGKGEKNAIDTHQKSTFILKKKGFLSIEKRIRLLFSSYSLTLSVGRWHFVLYNFYLSRLLTIWQLTVE